MPMDETIEERAERAYLTLLDHNARLGLGPVSALDLSEYRAAQAQAGDFDLTA